MQTVQECISYLESTLHGIIPIGFEVKYIRLVPAVPPSINRVHPTGTNAIAFLDMSCLRYSHR